MQYTAVGKYALAGAIVTGDTITWSSILPANDVQVLGFKIFGKELDTDASPTATLIVGDGTDTDGYLASKTAGDATGQMQFIGDGAIIGTSDQVGRDIIATVGGTVATAATTGTVWVEVTYYCNAV
jgi:hypothetical protein